MENIAWPSEVLESAKNDDLAFFIGNGVSRLSGAPSWASLLNTEEIRKYFLSQKINRENLSHYECADIISKSYPSEWARVLNRLQRWSHSAKPSYTHKAIGRIIRPGLRSNKVRVITSNVDRLLTAAGIQDNHISFCHGHPDKPDSWVFNQRKLIESFKKDKVAKMFDEIDASIILYIGYSHSHEDFDIANACIASRQGRINRTVFSIQHRSYSDYNYVTHRLNQHDITHIEHVLPNSPSLEERDLSLAHVLLQLASEAGLISDSRVNFDHQDIMERINKGRETSINKRKNSSFIIGLTGTNRHLQIHGDVPNGGRRHSIRAEIYVEPGGPAYIVAQVLKVTGNNSFLVSKIASDIEGVDIIRQIEQENTEATNSGTIYTDCIEISEADYAPLGFRTWESFIIEPSNPNLHRIFVDRSVDYKFMRISNEISQRVSEEIQKDIPRICYFDKFYRETIRTIFQPLSVDRRRRISDKVWIIYETGSEGDRYFSNPPESFDEESAYDLEDFLSNPKRARCINVVTASFRFARDYLARRRGKISTDIYDRLIHKFDSKEILLDRKPSLSEDEVIDNLVSNSDDLKTFCSAIARGGSEFLRDHPLRLIFVTLHRRGCLVISAPMKGRAFFEHVDGVKIERDQLFTASAGDIFRGVLTGALVAAQKQGMPAEDVMKKDFVLRLAALCNQSAAHKVMNRTVEDSLPGIKQLFLAWKSSELDN